MDNNIFYRLIRNNEDWTIVFLKNNTDSKRINNEFITIQNDINLLKEFFENNKDATFIGANNHGRDDKIITSLLKYGNTTSDVSLEEVSEMLPGTFDISQGIVRNYSIDFYNMICSLWEGNSKAFSYKYDYKNQDPVSQLKKDLIIIQSLYENDERKNYIKWKKDIIEEFNLSKNAYRNSFGPIMKEILGLRIKDSKKRSNTICLDPKLQKIIEEKNDKFLNEKLELLKDYYSNIETLDKQCILIDKCLVKFDTQGMFGSKQSDQIDANTKNNSCYLYIDFNSFGPNILINNNWLDGVAKHPENYQIIKDRRIALKANKDIKQLYYKYILNSGLDYLDKLDTKNGENIGISLTMTGIMTMLLLYSNIKPLGIELIECNTDGFIVKCPNKNVDKVREEVKKLEKELSLSCDVDRVIKIAHFDTQNYIIQYEDGSEKHLGCFGNAQTHPLYCPGRGRAPAVEIALKEYYLNGTPISVTLRNLRNENNIRAFQIVKRPKKTETQKYVKDEEDFYPFYKSTFRLFAVREDKLKNPLYTKNKKEKFEIYKTKRGRSVKEGYYYFELSDQEIPDIYDIDLDYYIAECYKIINKHPLYNDIQIKKESPKKYCFLDIDGTLIKDKEEAAAYMIFYNAARELLNSEEEIQNAYYLFNEKKGNYLLQFLGSCQKYKGYAPKFAEFLMSKDLFPGKTLTEYEKFVSDYLQNDRDYSTTLAAFTGSKELLEYLKSEEYTNLINSKYFKCVQEAKLESHDFDKYIDDLCTIDEYQAKPSLEGWKDILNTHNISSDDHVIMVGNGSADIVPKKLNIPSVIINHGVKPLSNKVLSNGIIINDFSEIKSPNFYSEMEKIKSLRNR